MLPITTPATAGSSPNRTKILLTGATGYIGGRLLRVMEDQGLQVRCLARTPASLTARVAEGTEVVQGDLLEPPDRLVSAFTGIELAYYLVHSMGDGGSFEALELQAARHFAAAAREAGVGRIVYLGGLGKGDDLSPHLRSRQAVGALLHESGIPTVELRASIILGSGSLSFEMIRALVEKLPFMITPRWVQTRAQPIAVEDVLAILLAAGQPGVAAGVYEIGGADVATYGDLMVEYARQRGLRRWMIPVPVLTPRLSSLWLGLVTPVYARIGRKLVGSIRNETVVEGDHAERVFGVTPRGTPEAIARALANEDREFAETRWSDAVSSAGAPSTGFGGTRQGSRLVDHRRRWVDASAETAFAPVRRIGGRTGWYFATWLWWLRGFIDLVVGGVGLRRGRRDPEELRVGDALDFWRVESYEPGRLLRLRAEMKLPGRAWLQLEVTPDPGGGSWLHQTALFEPRGLWGLLYWYGIWPVHAVVFAGLIRGLCRKAKGLARLPEPRVPPAPETPGSNLG